MLGLIVSAMAGLVAPSTAISTAICEVGRVALRDLPPLDKGVGNVSNYFDADPDHHGLPEVCPVLRQDLPEGYSLADEAAWAKANVHAPIPGKYTSSAFIYAIEAPKISADGKSATIEWGYTCTGLCGGGLVSRYVRTSKGWRRAGGPLLKWVS